MIQSRGRTALAAAALLVTGLAACSTGPAAPAGSTTVGSTPDATGTADATSAAARYTTPLADVCPATVVLQFNWWPQAEHGWAYQLIGDAGTADPSTYSYTGPLGSTGVDLEIRAGGPATGGQLPLAQLYQDDDILLGVTTTEDSVGNSVEFPTVSVFTYSQKTPLVFFWGNDDWDFKNLTDIKNSGQTVLAFEGAPFLDVLTNKGLLDPAQIDGSYDGDPARFVVEDGNVIQQGLLTSEVYSYEHDLPQWDKPVHYVKVGDEYAAYHGQVAIRADKLEANRACLAKLVPLLQQGAVDYAHDPGPTNAVLLDVVSKFAGSGWTLTPGVTEWGATAGVKEGIVANGTDGVFGSFDADRVNSFIEDVAPVLEKAGKQVKDGLTAQDIVTNEFLDPAVHL